MTIETRPHGLFALDEEGLRVLDHKGGAAHRLAVEAQDQSLDLIDQLAVHMKTLGIDAQEIERRSGLPAAVVEQALASGDVSLATFAIMARAIGTGLRLDLPVIERPWPAMAEILAFPTRSASVPAPTPAACDCDGTDDALVGAS